jgi:hypothetical protein
MRRIDTIVLVDKQKTTHSMKKGGDDFCFSRFPTLSESTAAKWLNSEEERETCVPTHKRTKKKRNFLVISSLCKYSFSDVLDEQTVEIESSTTTTTND